MSTFSKTLAPGLRLGWIIGPSDLIRRLAQARQGVDLHSSTFVQLLAYEVARSGFLDRHIHRLRTAYRARRDVMLAAMKKAFPAAVHWTSPDGGLFIWVTLPGELDAADVLREAIARKVAFVPGAAFFPDGSGKNTMRLNFTNSSIGQIEQGIARLGDVLQGAVSGSERCCAISITHPK